jgi:hypothetical protein
MVIVPNKLTVFIFTEKKMVRKSKGIYNLVIPIFKTWKYTALPIFKIENNIDTEQKKILSLKSHTRYIGVAIFVIYLCFNFKQVFKNSYSDVFDGDLTLAEASLFFIQNTTILLRCYKKREEICEIIAQLYFSGKVVMKVTGQELSYYTYVRNLILGIITFKYTALVVLCTFECIFLEEYPTNIILFYISWGFHFHFEIIMIVYLVVLKRQYVHLNERLKSQQCNRYNYYKLTAIVETHSLFRRIFKMINKTFGDLILVKILTDWFITSTGLFYVVQSILSFSEKTYFLKRLGNIDWILLQLISNFLLAFIIDDISQQVLVPQFCI